MNNEIKKWIEQDGRIFLKNMGIRKNYRVLDFGCGEGHYTIPLSQIVESKGKVYAIDKDDDKLNNLRNLIKEKEIKNIEVIHTDRDILLDEVSVDAVLCYDVLHYMTENQRKKIYNRIYKILKNKGLFSVYPKHNKNDYPLMEFTDIDLKKIIKEIQNFGFALINKISNTLLHDDYYNKGCILNFRKRDKYVKT